MEASQPLAGKSRHRQTSYVDRPPIGQGLSLILLAGADEATVATAIADAESAIHSVTDRYEILVVHANKRHDQNSATSRFQSSNRNPRVRVVVADEFQGPAWQQGLRQAQHEWVALADADGSYHVGELGRLLPLAAEFDAVCGYRIDQSHDWLHWGLSRSSAIVSGVLLRSGVRDPACGIKLFRRSLLADLPSLPDDDFSSIELFARLRLAGAEIVEVGVNYNRPLVVDATSGADWGAVARGAFTGVARLFFWLTRLVRFWWSQTLFAAPAAENTDARNDPESAI
jgi:dolichol-phosphate mannosyltransferase